MSPWGIWLSTKARNVTQMVLRKEIRFLGKTKKFAQTVQFWSQNVQLVPIKKVNIHTSCFHPQIKELSALSRDQIAVKNRHLRWEDFQKSEPYADRFCACDIFFDYHPQGNSKNCHSHDYGSFVWEFQVRYNNCIYNTVDHLLFWIRSHCD